MVRFDANLVDAVGDVLLLRCFQRLGQGVIQHDALLGVCLQFVNQHHLRRRLVLQTVDPGLTLFDITLQRLGLRQLDLFGLNQLVIAGVQRGKLAFQLSAHTSVLFDANLVFQCDNRRIHALHFGAYTLQLCHSNFAVGQGGGQIAFDAGLLIVQHFQLTLQQARNHIGFGNQILQFVVDAGLTHTLFAHGIRFTLGKETNQLFRGRLGPHFFKIAGKACGDVV